MLLRSTTSDAEDYVLLLVSTYTTQHSWHDRLTHSSTSAKRHGGVALLEYAYTRVPAYLQGRHAGHPGVYAYTCTTEEQQHPGHTQNGPRTDGRICACCPGNAVLPEYVHVVL